MNKILTELPGILFQMDDICIFGSDQEAVLIHVEAASQPEQPKFQGHVIDQTGIQDKTMHEGHPPQTESPRSDLCVQNLCNCM